MTDADDPFGLADLDAVNPPKPAREIPPALAALTAGDQAPRPRQKRAKFSRQVLTRHKAQCVTCGASNDRRNAQAWASGHANTHGGHKVALVLESVVADRDLDEADRLAVLDEAATRDRPKPDPTMRDSGIVADGHVAGATAGLS